MSTDPDATERRVRAALGELANMATTAEPRSFNGFDVTAGDRDRRSAVRWAVAASIVALVAAGVVVLQRRGGDDGSPIDSPTATVLVEEPAAWVAPGPDGSVALPPAPIEGRSTAASVWTGREMIVWGGGAPDPDAESGVRPFDDGAAFDPATGTWRKIAPSPLSARTYPAGVWTGTEMIVWGGVVGTRSAIDGAAYDPATDTWRSIPDAPLPASGVPAAVWTGADLVVTGSDESIDSDLTPTAAYTPSTGTWRRLPDLPGRIGGPWYVAWTGRVVLVALSPPSGVDAPGALFQLDPAEDDVWRNIEFTLPSIGLVPTAGGLVDGSPLGALVIEPSTGDGWTALDLEGRSRPDADVPQRTDGVAPAGNLEALWTGSEVLWWPMGGPDLSATGVAYDPATRTWRDFVVPEGLDAPRAWPSIVWADGLALVWGGAVARPSTSQVLADGFAYHPPTRPVPVPPTTSTVPTTAPFTVPPTTPAVTVPPITILAVYEDVAFYGACGNNSVEVAGITYYQLLPEELAELDEAQYPRPDSSSAPSGFLRVGPPGPGDDTGTFVVFSDGIARFESDSGLVEWLTTDERTYNWVC